MLEELWTEVHYIVQKTGIKTISKKKKCKKAKWLSEESLQHLWKEEKQKAKEKRIQYTHLNAESQRIARRDKKDFLSDQCKEIEEENRMGKTRDLFKKIRDTKGIFHAKIGTIKDRNGMKVTGAEDIKKRWQEYTQEPCKKNLHDWDHHDGMIIHLEPEILSAKSSGPWETSLPTKPVEVMEFQLSYFKSWKMILWKCFTQYVSKLGKLSNGHRTGKGPFSFQSRRKAIPKNAQTTTQLHSSHMLVK